MKKFYLYNGNLHEGPFSVEELKQKKISKTTPVWYEGVAQWTTAGQVDELKSIFQTVPPAFNIQPPSPGSKPSAKSNDYNPAPPLKSQNSFSFTKILLLVSAVIIVFIGIYLVTEKTTDKNIRNHIREYVTASRSGFNYRLAGGISGLEITVSNTSDYMMDNVRVNIDYIKTNGQVWTTEYLDFAFVGPHSEITLKAPDTNRGTDVRYEIASITSKELGL